MSRDFPQRGLGSGSVDGRGVLCAFARNSFGPPPHPEILQILSKNSAPATGVSAPGYRKTEPVHPLFPFSRHSRNS